MNAKNLMIISLHSFCFLTLREILLVVLTKTSQLYNFSKRYQKFSKITNTQKSIELIVSMRQ